MYVQVYTYEYTYVKRKPLTGMRIKDAFKGCLRFCGRPAISLRARGVGGASEFWMVWFMDGAEG